MVNLLNSYNWPRSYSHITHTGLVNYLECVCLHARTHTGAFKSLPPLIVLTGVQRLFNHLIDYLVHKSSIYKADSTYSAFPRTFSIVFFITQFLLPLYLPFPIIPLHSWSSVVCHDLCFGKFPLKSLSIYLTSWNYSDLYICHNSLNYIKDLNPILSFTLSSYSIYSFLSSHISSLD